MSSIGLTFPSRISSMDARRNSIRSARSAKSMSFWYDAVLVVLLAEPYAVDFVRHRCKQVARELCVLLPLLEPDPEAPAALQPRRGRQPTST